MTLIDRIKKHVVEEGDCWEWTGSLQMCGATPTMRYQGRVGSVRRFVLESQGVDLRKRVATYTCDNPLCVNPEHTAPAARRTVQRRTAKEQSFHATLTRRKKLAEKARAGAKLTAEQADQIREAEGLQRDIAARFGVTQCTVSAIKRGDMWRDYSNPFAGLMR